MDGVKNIGLGLALNGEIFFKSHLFNGPASVGEGHRKVFVSNDMQFFRGDRIELALALERAAAALGKRQRILLDVNIDEEPQKSGVLPADLAELLGALDALPHLEPLGLMSIPRACAQAEQVRPSFVRLRGLLEELNRGRSAERRLSELSMGMSADFEVAIQEGATCVRIGTAIFGARRTK